MTRIALTLNGKPVEAEVEPRTSLADFLRLAQRLTGTHLGCEHGVCGACTVMIDGAPARSCIAFAIALEGRDVRTVEGFEDDPVMAKLRQAFHEEHALQCGFCTSGMLITARDIVTRLEKRYGTQFEVTQRVDPDVIGGLRLTLGDRRIDGTVAGRLDELSRGLFASS